MMSLPAAAYAACQVFSQVGILGTFKYTFPVLHIAIFFAALCAIAAVYSVLAVFIMFEQLNNFQLLGLKNSNLLFIKNSQFPDCVG